MIDLNLLPYKMRRDLEKQYGKNASVIVILFTILFVFFSGSVVFADFFLSRRIFQLSEIEPEGLISEIQMDVAGLHAKATRIGDLQNNFYIYSDVLRDLSGFLGEDVSVTQVIVEGGNQSLQIDGIAKTGDLLFFFRDRLDALERFWDVKIRRTDVVGEEIRFKLSTKVNFSKL